MNEWRTRPNWSSMPKLCWVHHSLTFEALNDSNTRRATESYGHDWNPEALDAWRPTDWACATAGELGEACNLIKKQRRGEDIPLEAIAHELADTVIYLDLLAHSLGIDLGDAVVRKFDIVSDRVGSSIKLGRPEVDDRAAAGAKALEQERTPPQLALPDPDVIEGEIVP